MRSPTLALLAAGLLGGPAAGQDPAPLLVPPPATAPAPAELLAGPSPLPDCPWRADVVVGLPVAVRAQRRIGASRGWFEFGGAVYGPIPSVFAGVRADSDLLVGRRDCVHVRPGVDFYYSPIHFDSSWLFPEVNGIGVLALDFDLVWQHRWADRFHSQLGLKLGCGAGFGGGGAFPVPIVGVTVGGQF